MGRGRHNAERVRSAALAALVALWLCYAGPVWAHGQHGGAPAGHPAAAPRAAGGARVEAPRQQAGRPQQQVRPQAQLRANGHVPNGQFQGRVQGGVVQGGVVQRPGYPAAGYPNGAYARPGYPAGAAPGSTLPRSAVWCGGSALCVSGSGAGGAFGRLAESAPEFAGAGSGAGIAQRPELQEASTFGTGQAGAAVASCEPVAGRTTAEAAGAQ